MISVVGGCVSELLFCGANWSDGGFKSLMHGGREGKGRLLVEETNAYRALCECVCPDGAMLS